MAKIKTQKKPTYAQYAKEVGLPIEMVKEYNRARANWRRSAQKFAKATGADVESLYGYGLPDIRTQSFRSGRGKNIDTDWVQMKIDQQLANNKSGFEIFRRKNMTYLENAIGMIEEYSEDVTVPDWVKIELSKLTATQSEFAAQKLGVNKDFFSQVLESDQEGNVQFNEGKARARLNKLMKYLRGVKQEREAKKSKKSKK